MKGQYEPDCDCKPDPLPEITNIQTDKLPLQIGYSIRCRTCRKPWNETLIEWWQPAGEQPLPAAGGGALHGGKEEA